MTQDAVDLLTRWIAENVHSVRPEETRDEAARLAVEFRAYARDAGLSKSDVAELEEDIAEDLTSYMEDALLAARDAENGPLGPGAA